MISYFILMSLAQLADRLPPNVPYNAFPASVADMRHLTGRWKLGPVVIDVSTLGPGRGKFVVRLGVWRQAQLFYAMRRSGQLMVGLTSRDNAVATLMPRAIAETECIQPGIVSFAWRSKMLVEPIDVAATLRANPWLDGRKMDEDCPAFLRDMSIPDQQRLTMVTSLRDNLVLERVGIRMHRPMRSIGKRGGVRAAGHPR